MQFINDFIYKKSLYVYFHWARISEITDFNQKKKLTKSLIRGLAKKVRKIKVIRIKAYPGGFWEGTYGNIKNFFFFKSKSSFN
jgi:hypothetical protein